MERSASEPPSKVSDPRLGSKAAGCIALLTCSIDLPYPPCSSPGQKEHLRDDVCERWPAYETSIHRFAKDYESKYPKAVKSLITEVSRLLIHFELLTSHWKDLQNTNQVKATFATTVKLRTPVTKGPAWELLDRRWCSSC